MSQRVLAAGLLLSTVAVLSACSGAVNTRRPAPVANEPVEEAANKGSATEPAAKKTEDAGKPEVTPAKGESKPPEGHSVHKEHAESQLGNDE